MRSPASRCCWIGLILFALLPASPGCRTSRASRHASASITADTLARHIRALSSDSFEGRAPATPGEDRTIDYLTNKFRRYGLAPGNPDGSFIQRVPLVGSRTRDVKVTFNVNDRRISSSFPTQVVVWTKQFVPETKIDNSELVFVGYGIVAPEYSWDDYKGADLRGKTIVMLVNDPPVPDPADPARLDDRIFKGRAMTYYGRWTYKFEIAAARGAAAAIIVHETGPAGYPWAVVMGSNSRENFDLRTPDGNMKRAAVEGWITLDQAKELFTAAGQDFDRLKRAAVSRDFKPVPLHATASFSFRNELREVASQNVVALLEGSSPQWRNEYVVYSAHWDHLGRDATLQGDQIYNGAADNASGTASLLEIARAFTRLKTPPKRSILFLSVTAEEKGLLGAKYYATHPLYPLKDTLADINMDSMNPWGRTRDITVIGLGQTTLEDLLRSVAAGQKRSIIPDAEPEKGRYFRSDHFEFAKVGVPGLFIHSGTNFVGRPPGFGREKIDDYVAHDYHKVTDEMKPDWDLSGAAEDAQALFEVGLRVANGEFVPAWRRDSEFRNVRR